MKFAAARVCLNNICNKANHFVKRIKKSLKFRIKIHRKKIQKVLMIGVSLNIFMSSMAAFGRIFLLKRKKTKKI